MNRPNILLIHTDQQRADTLGCYGNDIIKTPNIDAFAKTAVTFLNAHCTHPLCSPARASWITGEYIHSHGLWRNGTALDEHRDNVVKSLANNGYHTGLIGKAHLTPYKGDPAIHVESMNLDNQVHRPTEKECWTYWKENQFTEGYYGYQDVRLGLGHGDYGMVGGHYGLWVHENHPETMPLFLRENGLTPDTSFDTWKSAVPMEVHSATWIAEQTEEYFESHRDTPFFLSVGFQEPHPPFNPPKPYCDMYRPEDMPDPVGDRFDFANALEKMPEHLRHYFTRDGLKTLTMERKKEIIAYYYGLVTLVDDAMGRILKSLEDNHLAENTIVIFTSDHGDWMGDHELNRKGGVHTRGLTRIPMIIRWPGVSRAGLRIEEAASQVDLAATIYDATQIPAHYTNQGLSLRKVLDGTIPAVREYALIEHCHECYTPNGAYENNVFAHIPPEQRTATIQNELINHTAQDIFMKTVVTKNYRFSYIPALNYGELYDWTVDTDERHNLYETDLELRNKAEKVMLKALIEATPRCQERTYGV